MEVILDQVWKRYSTGWILRDISKHIKAGEKVAVTGSNGSGKSTLIQIISGYLSYTKGEVSYAHAGQKIKRDDIYKQLAISAAYAEMDEELSIKEIFDLYKVFKPFLVNDTAAFLELSGFEKEKNRQIRYLSSGMKQRLSLSLAMCMDVPLLILDEPTSFLDESHKSWYLEMLARYTQNKTVIIASNDEGDIRGCDSRVDLG